MSPTIFRLSGCRFYFLSNEEPRMHIHVECEEGEAKFWIEPIVSLASYYGLKPHRLSKLQKLIEKKKDEIAKEWKKYFGKR